MNSLRSAVTLLLCLVLAACSFSSEPPAPSTPAKPAGVVQSVKLVSLPPIVQPGRKPASPDLARRAFVASASPVAQGRTVVLEVQGADGWRVVSKDRQDLNGRAYLSAPATLTGQYRARVAPRGALASVTSEALPAEAAAPLWTDEFKGTALNPAWIPRGQDYAPLSKRACSKGDPRAVRVGQGTLRLSILKDPDRKDKCVAQKGNDAPGKYAYRLSGHIGTINTFNFQYGVAAARIKMQPERGQHASFWMQPVGENMPGTTGQEIDVIEYFGDAHPQGGLTSFTHTYVGEELVKTGSWLKRSRSFLKDKKDSWSGAYHVFSVQWTPNVLIFRIDGKETWRTSRHVSQSPQYLILSLLASDYELPEMRDRQLPQHMYVDWVRVWAAPAS